MLLKSRLKLTSSARPDETEISLLIPTTAAENS
jgi:hypothetical protein